MNKNEIDFSELPKEAYKKIEDSKKAFEKF
jgi:hypothetical protein